MIILYIKYNLYLKIIYMIILIDNRMHSCIADIQNYNPTVYYYNIVAEVGEY